MDEFRQQQNLRFEDKFRIVRSMFINTADHDYALARWAFMNGAGTGFYWQGLHAVEKYLKAILLLNGRCVKKYRHNVFELFSDVRCLSSSFDFCVISHPSNDSYADDLWKKSGPDFFISDFLQVYGDPNNRYFLYGCSRSSTELIWLDRLVYCVRRYCRYFPEIGVHDDGVLEGLNSILQLTRDPMCWQVDGSTVLERAYLGGNNDDLRSAFFTNNYSFISTNFTFTTSMDMNMAVWEMPTVDYFLSILKSTQSPPKFRRAEGALMWMIENISCPKNIARGITDEISRQRRRMKSD